MDPRHYTAESGDPVLHPGAWESVFEAIASPTFVLEEPGRLVLANRAARVLLGVDRLQDLDEDARHRTLADALDTDVSGALVAPEDRPHLRIMRGEQITDVALRYRLPSGEPRDVLVSGGPVATTPGQPRRAVLMLRDVTEHRAVERRLQEEARAREMLVVSLSHDLRSPLTAILAQAQMVLTRHAAHHDVSQAQWVTGFERVQRSAQRINEHLEELADALQLQAGRELSLQRSRVDLVEVLRSLLERYPDSDIPGRLVWSLSNHPLFAAVDVRRFERAIGNVVDNALKYSAGTSTVRVALRREGPPQGPHWAAIDVHDQGVGIPAADLAHLFEWYFRAANAGRIRGSGLGLAGARRIIEQHGGTVHVVSEEGRGSTFEVRLPLA